MQYLYIAEEVTVTWGWSADRPGPIYTPNNEYSKIGITSQSPWERLRKLQVGNPRTLQFTHMWVGDPMEVGHIEKIIKGGNPTEWLCDSADETCHRVKWHIKHKEYEIYKLGENYTPYRATSYGKCKMYETVNNMYKRALTPKDIFKKMTTGL